MEIINLSLPGLKLLRLTVFDDERGYFKECYRKSLYADQGIDCEFAQDNCSYSKKNVIRGMHFQSEPGQAKLVSVIEGKIFDVVVDIRPHSPSFGQWEGVYLDHTVQLYIPVGFAHGFCVVSDPGAYVHYKVTTPYLAATEKTFRFDDPQVNISWPTLNPNISARDKIAPLLQEVVR